MQKKRVPASRGHSLMFRVFDVNINTISRSDP